jgi:SSS family solute:Na+ symporter
MFSLFSFVAFTAMVAIVSYLKTRNDDHAHGKGYFLAGNTLTGWVIAGSLMLTNLSTEQLIGLNGNAYEHGAQVMAWEIIAAFAMVVMALYFFPRYWKGQIATVPEFIEKRYDKQTRRFLGAIFLISIFTNFLPFVLYSGAIGLSTLFGVPDLLGVSSGSATWVMVWAIGISGGIYAIFGGLRAVAISDSINGLGLLIGGLLIPVLGLVALGDGSMLAGWSVIVENIPEKLDPIGKPGENIPFSTLFTGMIVINVYYWCTNQSIVQRSFGAKSLKEGQKGILIAACLKLAGPFYLVLPGIIAFQMFGPDLADKDMAYPRLVTEVLPSYLVGFFGAVIFGAILSSFNSGLHSCSTLFGLDIYRGMMRPNATDEQTVKAGKYFGFVLALVAMSLAPLIGRADGLFDLMKKLAAVTNVPILAIIFMGILTTSVSTKAAKISLFTGMGLFVVSSFVLKNIFFGVEIHWLHVAGANFAIMCVLMLVLSKTMKRSEGRDTVALEPETEGAWGMAKGIGFTVIVLVFLIYTFLHNLGSA